MTDTTAAAEQRIAETTDKILAIVGSTGAAG